MQSSAYTGFHGHVMPTVTKAAQARAVRSAATANDPGTLGYYGGKVISSAKLYDVYWGSPGSYQPQLDLFMQTVPPGPYMTWLGEYDTSTQNIGPGSFASSLVDTSAPAGTTINDSQIQSELLSLVASGKLPPPDGNNLYMFFFPQGVNVTATGVGSSCVDFCGYHETFTSGGSEYYYGVLPDPATCGSSCDNQGGNYFADLTSVTTHEITEAVTDPEVGIAILNSEQDGGTYPTFPNGWTSASGEIGDLCAWQNTTISGYNVQLEWSNAQNKCVSGGPGGNDGGVDSGEGGTTSDFSISASPSSLTLAQEAAGSSTISTAVTAGSAQTVDLAVAGCPATATCSLTPTSITAGGSSTLTVNAGTAAAGSYTLTVTGTEGTTSHSAIVSLTVTGGTASGIVNGGFETGDLTGWTLSGTGAVTSTPVHSGTYAAQVGGTTPTNGDSSIAQTFTAPSAGGTLSFWYQVHCPDTLTYDWATATLKDNATGATATVLTPTCSNSGAWQQASAVLTGGDSYTLTLVSHDDNYAGDPTYTLYDDVTVGPPPQPDFSIAASPTTLTLASGASATSTISTAVVGSAGTVSLAVTGTPAGATATLNPTSVSAGASSTLTVSTGTAAPGSYTLTVTGTEGSTTHSTTVGVVVTSGSTVIANGGFEMGNLTGWTASGPATGVSTTGHSGSHSAMLGATNPTNGTSSIAQTFTAPSGSTKVSFWYQINCPDTVTYDWATATLQDVTTNTTTTVLAPTCTNSGAWVQATATITAGHKYTLTLSSKDDDYAGDPTYTLYDDVVVQ